MNQESLECALALVRLQGWIEELCRGMKAVLCEPCALEAGAALIVLRRIEQEGRALIGPPKIEVVGSGV